MWSLVWLKWRKNLPFFSIFYDVVVLSFWFFKFYTSNYCTYYFFFRSKNKLNFFQFLGLFIVPPFFTMCLVLTGRHWPNPRWCLQLPAGLGLSSETICTWVVSRYLLSEMMQMQRIRQIIFFLWDDRPPPHIRTNC